MRGIGAALLMAGVIWLAIAFNLDTTVATGGGMYLPDRVENIGLIARRQNHLYMGGLTTLIGVLFIIFGGHFSTASEPVIEAKAPKPAPAERTLESDAYQLWLADHYGIKRNDLFDSFTIGERKFPDLAAALAHAHDLEVEALAEAERKVRAAEERARINLELEAEQRREFWKKEVWYIAGGFAFLFAIGAAFVMYTIRKMEREEVQNAATAKEMLDSYKIATYPNSKSYYVRKDTSYFCQDVSKEKMDIVEFRALDNAEAVAAFYHKLAEERGYKKTDNGYDISGSYTRSYEAKGGRSFGIYTSNTGTTGASVTICLHTAVGNAR